MNKKLAVLIFLISVVLLLIAFYLNSVMVLGKEEIVSTLRIDERASFEINPKALTFGAIIPGSSSQRDLKIENNYDFPIKVEFEVKGNITRFLIFDETVNLDIGEETFVRIDALIPVDEEYGDYSGSMIVTIKRDVF